MHGADAKCGQCRYYVHRPPEIVARCMLDGEEATANVACMIACSAMAGVYSMREEIDR